MTQFPHCDSRILHAPGECKYCDMRPDWQELRTQWMIAFTGHNPKNGESECPADRCRPPESSADHRRWGGNKPTSAYEHPSEWPEETFASRVFYGEPEDREP
jgi:hypothetical protein